MSNVPASPGQERLPAEESAGLRTGRQRYRLQVAVAALLATVAVCLPQLVSRDDPAREWGGIVMLGSTVLVGFAVLVAGGLLLALGRIRPMSGAFGKGAIVGVLVGALLGAILLVALPNPPPPPYGMWVEPAR